MSLYELNRPACVIQWTPLRYLEVLKQAKVQKAKELFLKVVCQPFQANYKARILKYLFDTKPLFIPGKQICNRLIKLVFQCPESKQVRSDE